LVASWLEEVKQTRSEQWAATCKIYYKAHWSRWGDLAELTSPAIQRYISDRLMAGAADSTVRKELSALHRFLLWCKRNAHLTELPTWEAPTGRSDHRARCFSAEEIEARLLPALPCRDSHPKGWPVREYYEVMWTYGARAGLLQRLCWEDVNFAAEVLWVRPGVDKERYGRQLPLMEPARSALQRLGPGVGLVFGRRHWMNHGTELAPAGAAVGIEKITGHDLRHSRATHLCSNTKDLASVRYILGHKCLETTTKYVHGGLEGARKLLREMARKAEKDGD
jgi:site-specific recombinase XerD